MENNSKEPSVALKRVSLQVRVFSCLFGQDKTIIKSDIETLKNVEKGRYVIPFSSKI